MRRKLIRDPGVRGAKILPKQMITALQILTADPSAQLTFSIKATRVLRTNGKNGFRTGTFPLYLPFPYSLSVSFALYLSIGVEILLTFRLPIIFGVSEWP